MSDEIIQVNPLVFGGEGESVHANMLTKLWENPAPASAFAAQNIQFASNDYDFSLWIMRYSTGDTYTYSESFPKGTDSLIRTTGTTAAAYTNTHQRALTRVSDTEYTVGDNYEQASNNNRAVNNIFNYPIAVYGFKKSLDVTAIVSEVSTDARKCMLSDGVTSVEDALNAIYKIESPVSSLAVTTQTGSGYTATTNVATDESCVGKNIKVSFIPSDGKYAIPCVGLIASTYIQILFFRLTSATIDGKLYIEVG